MWNPPIALSAEEQTIAVRTRQARKLFVLLREHRHELLEADFQPTLTTSSSPESGGHEPGDAGLWAWATRWQASCHGGDREAVELTVRDKRWQRVLDCLGAAPPPCSQGTQCTVRMRLIAHTLDQTLRERTVALAEHTGGFGARQLRAVLDAPPLFGAGRGADTLNLLGHARRKAVGLAAQAWGTSAEAVVANAGLPLVGPSRLQAARDLDGGAPSARERALGLGLEAGARWQHGLEPPPPLAAAPPPLQEGMETITQLSTPATAPAPGGGPSGRRLTQHVAPARRLSIEAHAMRHGRKSSAKPCNGFPEPGAGDVESKVLREVGVRPAKEPAPEAVELLAAELENPPGWLQLDSDRGSMASPRMAHWEAQGVDIMARPWPQVGPLCTTNDCTLDLASMQGTCPGGQSVPMVPGP